MCADSCYAFQTMTFLITSPTETRGSDLANQSTVVWTVAMKVVSCKSRLLDSDEMILVPLAPCALSVICECFLFP
jgi:hypothetical protein